MINKVIISDTSCLIALDRIGQLEILHKTFPVIITTPEVQKEFGNPLPPWILIQQPKNLERIRELEKIVDKGESSAITLALEIENSILIIDEKKGRTVARKYHLEIIGTLKVLLIAKQFGIVPTVKELVNALSRQNFRFSNPMLESILREANEL